MLRGTEGVVLTYDSEEAFVQDWKRNVNEMTVEHDICAKATKKQKRMVLNAEKLGKIASIIARLPRITYQELSILTGISVSTLKHNAKVQRFFDIQQGAARQEAEERYRE